jgi:hypothetical protein
MARTWGTCQFRSLLRRCHKPASGSCQYCGRSFCRDHGVVLDGDQEVCIRRICQQKVDDLREHLVYRDAARVRSAHGRCAALGCEAASTGQCSKCGALYCGRHLHDREETVHRGLSTFTRVASFCDHCQARRRLWSRL